MGLLDDQARNDPEGLAHHRSAFARLSKALADQGIAWSEPEVADPPVPPAVSTGFPYSYIHHLRRIFVLRRLGEPITSAHDVDEDQLAGDRELVNDEMTMFDSHLLCHADDAGYYIPVDFSDPLFLDAQAGVEGGGMVGSSQQLLAELVRVARSLGIHLESGGVLSAAEESALLALEPNTSFEMEKFAWLQLYRACTASIAGGHAIVFH